MSPQTRTGLLLLAATAIALLTVNLGGEHLYHSLQHTPLAFGMSAHEWVNDGLMCLFFALAGMEIRREFQTGYLSHSKQRWLPLIAAAGGFILPVLIYLTINRNSPATLQGWAIPAATDIAFAIALAGALGKHMPRSLTVFILALAVIDDLMAILAIAVFYSGSLHLAYLGAAAALGGAMWLLARKGVTSLPLYAAIGVAMWVAVLNSGVHATVAGVAWGLLLPPKLNHAAEHKLLPFTYTLVLPLFAFLSTGIVLAGVTAQTFTSPVLLGTVTGLMLGKLVGVAGAVWLAVKLGLAHHPAQASWKHIIGVAAMCGIGFTMSLFIGGLAFATDDQQTPVRLAVLLGSIGSALLATAILLTTPKET